MNATVFEYPSPMGKSSASNVNSDQCMRKDDDILWMKNLSYHSHIHVSSMSHHIYFSAIILVAYVTDLD